MTLRRDKGRATEGYSVSGAAVYYVIRHADASRSRVLMHLAHELEGA
jgi:hypothetical protein